MDRLNKNIENLLSSDGKMNRSVRINNASNYMARDYLWSKDFRVSSDDVKYLEEHDLIKIIPFRKNKSTEDE